MVGLYDAFDTLEINGVKVSGAALAHLLNSVTNPDPNRWYNYSKEDDHIVIKVEMRTPEPAND